MKNKFLTPNGNTGCRKCAETLAIWLQDNAPETFTENEFYTIMQRAPLTTSYNECQTYPCAICIMGKKFVEGV